ncbi:MAG: 4Fe-4S cluster-binding domain-containing protein [Synergistaceae bacterium]|nr:4Fe-4S cluster-binding domain-containing protein [Synergistaceae bacterium]
MKKKIRFSPTICVTHNCNLNCVYCYQKHDSKSRMPYSVAQKCVDYIFENIPDYATDGVELGFIGGEPLLEFELIRGLYDYSHEKYPNVEQIFYATTNGTVLTDEMKTWFTKHKEDFVLGLSLDGIKYCHDVNRSNSFDKIDINFFLKTWPNQGVKMTISEFSLPYLAENIKFIHSLGVKKIKGVNLAEGNFPWADEKHIKILIPQLSELVDFYLKNDSLLLDQMFDKRIEICETGRQQRKKWCGIGTGCPFFDVDGKKYPCSFITPMTFSAEDISDILSTDFKKDDAFVDDDCFETCYIYPICPTCSGANYLKNHTFKIRDKSRCKIQKLIALFIADLQAKRIVKNPALYDEKIIYSMINAIEKIRSLYLQEFSEYL